MACVFRERVLNITRLEANVQHLKPNASYEFRVQAYNRAGPSTHFAQLTVTTQQESKTCLQTFLYF